MLGNRRNLVFRVSIVINICVILYAAMHFSGNPNNNGEWVTITADGSETKAADFRYLNREDIKNYTTIDTRNERILDSSVRIFEESTSQKSLVPSTATSTKKVASSTVSVAVTEKKSNAGTLEDELVSESLDIEDENALSDATLSRLRKLLACTDRPFQPQTVQRGYYWVLKNYVRADHGEVPCHESITYTTHAGYEFLDNVLPLVERWMAPISIAIHAPGTDMGRAVNSIRYLRDCSNSSQLVRQYVTFHLFFPNKHLPNKLEDPEVFMTSSYNCSWGAPYSKINETSYMKEKSILYPVNVARNIAREAALTHFILPSDIELYPSPYLTPRFLNMIARNGKPLNVSTKPRVFPISIFEVDKKASVPSTKTELKKMLDKKLAVPFHKFVCPGCHNIPEGNNWLKANETTQMEVFHVGKRRGKFVHWEPIFIGTHQDPYYEERLSWEGKKDKMTQGYILCVKDYDFMILNNAFLVHKPGIKHFQRDKKRDSITGKQNQFVTKVLMPELIKLFGTRSGCSV